RAAREIDAGLGLHAGNPMDSRQPSPRGPTSHSTCASFHPCQVQVLPRATPATLYSHAPICCVNLCARPLTGRATRDDKQFNMTIFGGAGAYAFDAGHLACG